MVVGRAWPRTVLAAVTGPAVVTALAAVALSPPGIAAASTHKPATVPAASGDGTAAAGFRQVSYRGYHFRAPAGWQVINLITHPTACVRFDRHALYLGLPGSHQVCPSVLVGATEAVLIEPASPALHMRSVEDPVSHRITVTVPRVKLTASYQANRAEILSLLTSAGLPQPQARSPQPAAAAAETGQPALLATGAAAGAGEGFDACTAPSSSAMHAWLTHSSYRAVGIYIGGSDRACAQPNLTAAWVSEQAAEGWHFIPLYVGPQVAFGREVTAPRNQAVSSAKDAVVQARALGFGPGAPIYYDMEAYPAGRARTALNFFSAWTGELHSLGYRSAIYSSSGSGISDLVRNFSSTYHMPDIIYDALWNGSADTTDPAVPATYWANHQRVHQFSGGTTERHGGYQINIDRDYLDVQLAAAVVSNGTRQASQAAVGTHGVVDAFYKGTDGALWYSAYRPKTHWSASARLGGSLTSQPSAVETRRGGVQVFYRTPGGGLNYRVSRRPGWSSEQSLSMGVLGSGPRAVSTARGQIEVFWRGQDLTQLWNAQFTPGSGWQGPTLIATGLASAPAPAVSGRAKISVFWKGTGRRLWQTSLGAGSTWAPPAAVTMQKLWTWPSAAGLSDGEIDVFWGDASHQIWRVTRTRARGWSAPTVAGSNRLGRPFVVSSSAGAGTVFWRVQGGALWHANSQPARGWGSAAPLPLGSVGRGLFAGGQASGILDVFWRGPGDGHLWHGRFNPRTSSWTRPNDLGGSVAG
jgi:Rv2525c-like, glycoside hydrolase-like domain